MSLPMYYVQQRLRSCLSSYLISQTLFGNAGCILKKLQKVVKTAAMMVAIVAIYNSARYVCIITDPDEPRSMVYRLVTGFAVLLGAFLLWMLV